MTAEARGAFLSDGGPIGLMSRAFWQRRFSAYRRRL
jgi:hypothetical protein